MSASVRKRLNCCVAAKLTRSEIDLIYCSTSPRFLLLPDCEPSHLSVQGAATSSNSAIAVPISTTSQRPTPQAMPSAAVTQTVAAVVRPSTVRVCASRRITPAPMKPIWL